MLNAVQAANLALRFILELCALAALAWWGWRFGSAPWSRLVMAVGVPLVAAIAWGVFASPQASVSVPALRVAVQIAVFGGAALALLGVQRPGLAAAFACFAVLNAGLMAVWHQ